MPINDAIPDFVKPKAQAAEVESKLQREVDATNDLRKHESVLSRGITELLGVRKAGTTLSGIGLNSTTAEMLTAAQQNRDDRLWEQDVSELGTGLLKTACLFLKGRTALAATAAVFALDEIKPGSTTGEMVLDGTLGAAKGVATREILHWAAGRGFSPGQMGLMIGGGSRLADTMLTRSNYFDKDGKLDLTNGVANIAKTTFNPLSMASDYAVFSFSHAALGKLDGLTNGRIGNSPFWRTVATGESIGLSSGLVGESMRQYQEGEFDPMRILKMGLAKGALDGIAAIPGGFQASRIASSRPIFERTGSPEAKQAELLKPAAGAEPATRGVFDTAQPELVTDRMAVLKTSVAKPDANFSAWAEKNLEHRDVPSVQYRADGVRIIVPESYNEILGQLRTWRAEAAQKGITEMPQDHPLYKYRNRALPEDVAEAIRSSPNSKMISRVRLLDMENPQDHYTRQSEPDHRSAMATGPDRTIELYQPERGWLFGKQFGHEWWHIAKNEMPEHSSRFDMAAQLERDGFFADTYGRTGVEENWTTHASGELAGGNPSRAAIFADKAPLRSAVILSAAQEALRGTHQSEWSPQQRALAQTINEILPRTVESARNQLKQTINNPQTNVEDTQAATKLLLHFGRPEDFSAITRAMESLSFDRETLTSDAIRNLTMLPKIENITFNGTTVEAEAYKLLPKVPGLRSLTFNNVAIEDYDLGRLANSLSNKPGFKFVDMQNHWGDISATTQAVLDGMKRE